MIVYASKNNNELYSENEVDFDAETKEAEGYTRYQLLDSFTFTAQNCLGRHGDIVEILFSAGVLRNIE